MNSSSKRERSTRSGKGEAQDSNSSLGRPFKRQRQLLLGTDGLRLHHQPLLVHKDCFSVVLGFLEPRDWASLLVTGREWSSWVQDSSVWYQYLQGIHKAALAEQQPHRLAEIVHPSSVHFDQNKNQPSCFSAQEARRLVGALLESECLFHPGEEGSCGHPLQLQLGASYVHTKAYLCLSCRSRYRSGRVMKLSLIHI